MALGAGQEKVLAMVLKEALIMAGIGAAVGVALAIVATRVIATSLLAALIPALRACRTPPLDALRSE